VTDTAPVVTPTNANVNVGHGTVAATSLFTAADADTDSIVQYDFWDSGGGGGHWLLNGAALTPNQDNFVNATQIAQVTYQPGSGTDTLYVRASDGLAYGNWTSGFTVTGPANALPLVTPVQSAFTASRSQTYAASSLFTASDSDGDPIAQYDFWDSGAGGGHWLLNGAALTPNQDNFVNATQLGQVTYRSGSSTDTLYVRASDGLAYGNWTSGFTVTGPADTAPVVHAVSTNVTVSHGTPVAASSLFTASDGDGDPIVQYDFWDSGQAGGHWYLNNQQLGSNQDNFVPAAQLGQVTYQGGTGTETIWERASDGLQYSAWVSVNATDPVGAPTGLSVNVGAGQTVEIATAFSGTATFAGDNGTLKLDDSAEFSGTIAGLTSTDTLDLADMDPAKVQPPTFNGNSSGGTLSVSDGTHSANIALLGNYLASTFTTSSDGHGGTSVIDPAVLGGVAPLVTPPHA
jgi:hypothetical protein